MNRHHLAVCGFCRRRMSEMSGRLLAARRRWQRDAQAYCDQWCADAAARDLAASVNDPKMIGYPE